MSGFFSGVLTNILFFGLIPPVLGSGLSLSFLLGPGSLGSRGVGRLSNVFANIPPLLYFLPGTLYGSGMSKFDVVSFLSVSTFTLFD